MYRETKSTEDEETLAAEPLLQKHNDESDKEMELFEPSHNENTLLEQYNHLKSKQQIEFTIHDPSQILKDEKMMEMLNNDDDKGVSFTWNSDPIASVLHSNNETNKKNQQTKNQNKTRNFQIFFNLKSYRPYFIISISLLQIVIFVIELIYNQGVTPGWWINLNQTTLINMGAKVTPLIQEGEWWRLITATYLHAGFLHLIFNIISQLVIGLQTEQFIGWWRMAFIYFWSGVGGCLTSAIFLPRAIEAGASSAMYGLLGIYFVDLGVNWALHDRKRMKIIQIIVATVLSLIVGLLPYIDNFAHIGGLITGVFASLVIVPRQYLLSHNYEYIARRRTIRRAIIGGIFLVGYIGGGLYLLFNHVDMEAVCQWCEYLSCLPIFEYCIEFHNSNNNNYNSNKNNVVPSPSQR